MQPDQEMGPAYAAPRGIPLQEGEGEKEKRWTTCSSHQEPEERGNRNSQIKWELQQYPTYPELLENRSSKLMLFFFQQLKANASSPKWKLLKAHSSLFHAVMELCPETHVQGHFLAK